MSTEEKATEAERIEELERELKLHQEYREKQLELCSERTKKQATVDELSTSLKEAKKLVESLDSQLAQMTIDGPIKQEDFLEQIGLSGQGTAWAGHLPDIPPDQMVVYEGQDGYPQEAIVRLAVVSDQQMSVNIPTLAHIADIHDTPHIVSHKWECEETGALRVNLLPLITKKVWKDLSEKEFGPCLDNPEAEEGEATLKRQKGGKWAGRVVKNGKTKYVIGAQEIALHVVYHEGKQGPIQDGDPTT